MDEARTKLVLEAEARGFDRVQKIVEDVVGAVDGSGGKTSAMAALEKTLSGITTSLGKLDDVVASLAKNAKVIGGATGGGSGGGTGTGAGGNTPTPKIEPNFLRGVLQGVGIAQYLPGATPQALARQAAGNLVGRAGAGVTRGVVGSAFSGISSIVGGMQSIPGAGLLTGPAQAGIAAAEEALELQRAQRDAAFALDLSAGRRAAAAARAPAMAAPLETAASVAAGLMGGGAVGARGGLQLDGLTTRTGGVADSIAAAGPAAEAIAAERNAQRQEAIEATASPAAAARARALYGPNLAAQGVRYGMDQTETTRFAAEVARGRGGFIGDMNESGGLRAALAAQALGVDSGTSGSILRGTRTGALQGGANEGDALAQAFGRSVALGLQGSEVGENLQRMADGIQNFETTGLPLAPGASDAIARGLIGSGMANGVAAGRASAFAGAVQSRAAEGLPGSAIDFSALVHLGGYSGGGTEEALAARARLMRKDFDEGGLDNLTRTFAGQLNTGQYGRAYGVEQGFRRLGLSLGADEAMALDARASGAPISKEQLARIEEFTRRARRGPSTTGELEDMAEGAVGGGLQRSAGIRNTRLAAGQTVLKTVQDFEARAARAAAAFSPVIDKLQVLNPLLDGLVDGLSEVVRITTGRVVVQSGE